MFINKHFCMNSGKSDFTSTKYMLYEQFMLFGGATLQNFQAFSLNIHIPCMYLCYTIQVFKFNLRKVTKARNAHSVTKYNIYI